MNNVRFTYQTQRGFSLVELSIVLVILGLLVGGVLSGQALIHAAELRAIPKEYANIISITHTFRDKYFALPGDFPQATRVWGEYYDGSGPCTNNTGAAQNGGKGACDGNGDGRITACAVLGGCTGYLETSQFWWQLARASLLANPLISGSNGAGQDLASRYGQLHWSTEYYPRGSDDIWPLTPAEPQNLIVFGGGWGNSLPSKIPAIIPEDAWNVDTKIDDGKAGSGNVQVQFSDTNCYSSVDYMVSYKGPSCSMIFYRPF